MSVPRARDVSLEVTAITKVHSDIQQGLSEKEALFSEDCLILERDQEADEDLAFLQAPQKCLHPCRHQNPLFSL